MTWLWIAAIVLVILQIVPLPDDVLHALAPRQAEILPRFSPHASSEPILGVWNRVSLYPRASLIGLGVLLSHGVRTYSIFLHPDTQQLFAYVEFQDELQWEAISRTEPCRRWWKHMSNIMPTNEDDSPVNRPLIEVFHLENSSE